MNPLIGSLVRHGLTSAGAYIGLTGSDVEAAAGAVMTLVGLGWSIYNNRKAR